MTPICLSVHPSFNLSKNTITGCERYLILGHIILWLLLYFTKVIFFKGTIIILNTQLTHEMTRWAIIVALKTEHGILEIFRFLKVTRCFVCEVHEELETKYGNISSV